MAGDGVPAGHILLGGGPRIDQDKMERCYLSTGLGTPWCIPGYAGRNVLRGKSGLLPL